jgi:phosphoribosylformimino-5-aminoimidazole carboxamide ribonucleotide (ProFAR) isomerase
VLAISATPVIASGGVGSLDDLVALAGLVVDGRRLAGVIAGRAIYEGRFTVAEGLALLEE